MSALDRFYYIRFQLIKSLSTKLNPTTLLMNLTAERNVFFRIEENLLVPLPSRYTVIWELPRIWESREHSQIEEVKQNTHNKSAEGTG